MNKQIIRIEEFKKTTRGFNEFAKVLRQMTENPHERLEIYKKESNKFFDIKGDLIIIEEIKINDK